MTTQEVYSKSTVQGMQVKLPDTTLDRNVYVEVKTTFSKNGGKWVGGKTQAFVFDRDPQPIIDRLIGGEKVNTKKEFQEYFTPLIVCEELCSISNLHKESKVCEPSAGSGNILSEILKIVKVPVDFCELQPVNVDKVIEKFGSLVNRVGFDFLNLEVVPEFTYDSIVANPPFSNGQDIEHLRKMYKHLNSKGVVVCITSISWLSRDSKKFKEFRKWIGIEKHYPDTKLFENSDATASWVTDELSVYIKTLPSETFRESGANVRSLIVRIQKIH
jgi:hypothetical protein